MKFLGTYPVKMDEKKRVALPPMYREAFGNTVIITTGVDPCIAIYSQEAFDEADEQWERIPEETETGREARRDFYANAQPIRKDAQGRVGLDDKWIEHAGIDKSTREVVVVGAGRYMEVWDRATWDARDPSRSAARKQEYAQLADRRGAAAAGGG